MTRFTEVALPHFFDEIEHTGCRRSWRIGHPFAVVDFRLFVSCQWARGNRRLNVEQNLIRPAVEGDLDRIEPVDIATADRYVWGGVSNGWHLLKHPDLSVIQESVPAGAGEVEHYHARARQFFYILSGSAALNFGETAIALHAGQGLHVPPGVRHRFANDSDDEVVFLVISTPATAGDRIDVTQSL